jgi:hypothetical protein
MFITNNELHTEKELQETTDVICLTINCFGSCLSSLLCVVLHGSPPALHKISKNIISNTRMGFGR